MDISIHDACENSASDPGVIQVVSHDNTTTIDPVVAQLRDLPKV